jgi:hypothetical protein
MLSAVPGYLLEKSGSLLTIGGPTCVTNKQIPWPESAKELYPLSERRLSAKLVPTFEYRRCCVVGTRDP